MAADAFADVLARPSSQGEQAGTLTAWDDFPIHQAAAPVSSVHPGAPGWTERFYFNAIRPSGELVAVVGGGVYPNRGLGEFYFCRMDGEQQVNVRGWHPLPAAGAAPEAGPFALRCDAPLADWTLSVDLPDAPFAGSFAGTMAPYLYPTIDVPASTPGGPFDLHCHFVGLGAWSPGTLGSEEPLLGVRDRTWGVRSRRPRFHLWSVLALGERTVAFHHQELADGTVLLSRGVVVHADGRVAPQEITAHELQLHPQERLLDHGRLELTGEDGTLELAFDRVGQGMRLAGAGYDDHQGERGRTGGLQRDQYDLTDPGVAARTGRGTIDSGVRVRASGAWSGAGIGVVETAVARDHVGYGGQLAR